MTPHRAAGAHGFQFAVIADSHIRPPSGEAEGGYPSNRHAAARNRHVVDYINRLAPDFVIHLGDIVHPIPALPNHADAVALARDIYAGLSADLHVLPGNHDIGDKPNAWMPAPVVDATSHGIFEKHWGAPYQSFDHRDCHFVLLDTPVLNSGLPQEQKQKAWLERDLARNEAAGRRLFIFIHYPVFLFEPGEPRHYDNIDEPARSWLLGLLRRHGAEAVFAGHVHNFFFNRLHDTNHYILPSTAFVRPEYAELARVAPGREFGRDDGGKLGFFMVRVFEGGHAVDPIRTHGYGAGQDSPAASALPRAPSDGHSRLGVSLRHSWSEVSELPTDGLDEFTRKRARNDYIVQALWELRTNRVRIPLGDLACARTRQRIADLAALECDFTVFSVGVPDDETAGLIEAHARLLSHWEAIAPQDRLAAAAARIAAFRDRSPVPVCLSPVVPMDPVDTAGFSFQHFASHGFAALDEGSFTGTSRDLGLGEKVDGVTFRVSPFEAPWEAMAGAARQTEGTGLIVMVNLQLARVNEGVAFDDDIAVANRVAEAAAAATAHPSLRVFLDSFMDHDRGYYPRNALIDRRYNPRPAFHGLRNLESLLPGAGEVLKVRPLDTAAGARAFALAGPAFRGVLHLVDPGAETAPLTLDGDGFAGGDLEQARYLDLLTGAPLAFCPVERPHGTGAIQPGGGETARPGPRLFISRA